MLCCSSKDRAGGLVLAHHESSCQRDGQGDRLARDEGVRRNCYITPVIGRHAWEGIDVDEERTHREGPAVLNAASETPP